MPLTDDDLKAIGTLMDLKLQPVFERMDQRDSEVNARFDALIKQNEDREREYQFMSAQLGRHDKQLGGITEQLERHDKKLAIISSAKVAGSGMATPKSAPAPATWPK